MLPMGVLAADKLGEYQGTSLLGFLQMIQNYLLGFAGALATLFIVIGGVMMMTSSGNPQRLETAKKTLTYSIGGLAVILLAWVILTLIVNVFIGSIFTGSAKTF